MDVKRKRAPPHDFEADADEALIAARAMAPGPERIEALKRAGKLRSAADAAQFPPGEARQHALRNAAQLRSFADMKRQLIPDHATLGAKAKE